jgi:hypothetical protein
MIFLICVFVITIYNTFLRIVFLIINKGRIKFHPYMNIFYDNLEKIPPLGVKIENSKNYPLLP